VLHHSYNGLAGDVLIFSALHVEDYPLSFEDPKFYLKYDFFSAVSHLCGKISNLGNNAPHNGQN
jgi:hypothetical protein